ncbi:MAG: DUF4249 family protein [Gemmatimonas sp.]|nr:DUF4249 family protein [Gemmatimonas sp.]
MGLLRPVSPDPERLQQAQRALLLLRLRQISTGEVRVQHVPVPAGDRRGGDLLNWGVGSAVAVLALGLAGCELAEVEAPESADLLVVESVLRVGSESQYVLLHRSLNGSTVRGEPGATVAVVGPDGERVEFDEATLQDCVFANLSQWEEVDFDASCYLSPRSAGNFVEPGTRYELSIETTRGEIARGRTTVPGVHEFRVPAVPVDSTTRIASCTLSSDPFTLSWSQSEGAWGYIISLEISSWGDDLRDQGIEVPDPIELTTASVSVADTSLLFPANIGLFQRFDLDQRLLVELQQGLPENADAVLVVVAADPNYTNSIRGGRFNPSGSVRVSSVVGDAVGVFGSVVPLMIRSFAAKPSAAPPACPEPG